ncbi:hypothetical protein [Roseovarius nitratireducens]|uniref:hypothetical protein n=1 Tax=Roseovarius nitratireducens TaxID=2044597 RepID=UPI00101AEABF|nr:hypothetical protein [Roseovarius nitratireducens]
MPDLPIQHAPRPPDVRREDDFYPTAQPDAARGLILAEGWRLSELGGVISEPAVGDGHLAREFEAHGFTVRGGDLVQRKWEGITCLGSFYEATEAAAPVIITNPPFSEISARDGHGRWLRHTLSLPGWRYLALLLSWDWCAAQKNGHAALLDAQPFSYAYVLRWKLDFTGERSPPQRNAWFIWDRDDPRSTPGNGPYPEPSFRFMDKPRCDTARQVALL